MRITKQSSGGRGEYELCDFAPNGLGPADLLQLSLQLKIGDHSINTGINVTKAQGKYRLRLDSQKNQHAHFQVSIALLLPKPVRDEKIVTGGEPVLRNGSYIIKNINFGEVIYEEARSFFIAEVMTIDASNQTVLAKQIPARQRMEEIERIWAHRTELPQEVSRLLGEHEQIVREGKPILKTHLRIVENLQSALENYSSDFDIAYSRLTDPVPVLLELISEPNIPAPISLNEIEPDDIDLRKREVTRWQVYARRRGPASVRFRREVREAYNWKCLICAARLPGTSINLIPGIDAAHILPWAEYELDEVYNGIALCKLHHWAFDERLLQINFRQGEYYVDLSPEAENVLFPPDFSIDILRVSVGRISRDLLPKDRSLWPKASLLQRLYTESP